MLNGYLLIVFKFSEQEGISLFAFHGKLNEEFEGREAGTWARDVVRVRNGRYTFRDRDTQLKVCGIETHPQLIIINI